MKLTRLLLRLACVMGLTLLVGVASAAPLRVFVRGGPKSHGPDGNGVHDHLRFLNEWVELLKSRGCEAEGGIQFPTDEQLGKADVMVMYAQEGGNIPQDRRAALDAFLKRGGGLVVIHTATVSADSEHWKNTIGGSWVQGRTKWREGPMDLYYVDNQDPVAVTKPHPITKGASNFHLDDEIYYDMDISPDVHVLATSYTPNVPQGRKPAEGGKPHIYDIQPQMWTYEKDNYRAFVSIPGHLLGTFAKPNYRAVLLRGIAWAGKRENIDELVAKEELASLTYPEGGPQKPADTLKNLEIHPDFNLTLVASEPLINKPMNFDWDPAGRLWVAETPEYPNGRRGMRPDYRGREWKDRGGIDMTPGEQERKALDRISILTDTDGDGVMDKKDVFFDGLDLVTGLVFHKDGVIVTQAPDILWLRDKDGDGKAETVEKLYGNLGTGDTHAVINNPRRGWDGWIYATHGYSASNKVVNAKGEPMPNIGSGVVRFRPDGSAIEQYSSKGGNTWGLTITGDNRVMWTQPTSGTILEHTVLPEYALARGKWGNTPSFNVVIGSPKSWAALTWEQLAYVQIDLVGSFTATAGCVIYDGGSWPKEYNGDYFTTEPTINIVHHERLTPKGASFTGNKLPGREETEFIRSKDMWWRPIEVRVGPDGAVYVGDFYNQAVIHNDTRGPDHNRVNAAVRPDRDHYFGRIWRLDHKQAAKLAVPDLSKAGAADLVKALEHPSRHVRMNAARLLADLEVSPPGNKPFRGTPVWRQKFGIDDMATLATDASKTPESRIAALWTLTAKNSLDEAVLTKALQDPDADVRRNAALVIENKNVVIHSEPPAPAALEQVQTALVALLSDADAHVRMGALRAIGATVPSDASVKAIVSAWPKFDDDYQKSAAVGALAQNSAAAIAAILDSGDAALAQLAGTLVQSIGEHNDTAAAVKLVTELAGKPAGTDALKRSILDTLGKSLKSDPEMTPELTAALTKLLGSGASGSVLPLAARWDKQGTLKEAMGSLIKDLFARLNLATASEDERFAAAEGLLGLRSANAEALPAVLGVIAGDAAPGLKLRIISALGDTGDAAVGPALAAAFGKLPPDAQTAAFSTLIKRADWSLAFLDAVKAKQVDMTVLGPANVYRLRTHPDKAVSKRASEMMDELMPGAKAKAEVIAKLAPEVEKPGADLEQGKLLFNVTCATCHKFGATGVDVGPTLTGMGAHGAGELLTAIVDPNREVDPSFTAWNIETKDGQAFAGIVARENPASVYLKFQGGEKEIRTADIKSRTNTGRSLMPEGFDGLGPDVLRNIIAYMQSVDGGKFRVVDLKDVYTADTRQGLYASQEAKMDTLPFKKFGTVPVEGVPFVITDASKNISGNNVLVLKGGPRNSYAGRLPARAEAKLGGFKANRLHFLGGVTGWGYQGDGDPSPVMKVTVHYTDGEKEELVLQNGVEFADYGPRVEVPGSKFADVVHAHQVRYFAKKLKRAAPIEKLVLESFGNGDAAPTTVAITAELADDSSTDIPVIGKKTAAAPLQWKGTGPKVLLVGGGSSHDFQKWFNEADTELLTYTGYSVAYTEDPAATVQGLADAKVAVLSVNSPKWATPDVRKALFDFAAAGDKGLVLFHPGVWYNFNDWPEYNKVICGGGSRGHDRIQEFDVKAVKADHPALKDVPASFKITDELYWFEPSPEGGTPIEILATAHSPQKNKEFPMVWTVGLPKCRTIAITLGHDGRAHEENEAFRKLLTNSVGWAAGK